MIKAPIFENDNPAFIKNVNQIIDDRVSKWAPKDFYLTRIDNWFDDKWVKFSGTIEHELSIHKLIDVTVPPFHPNRVEVSKLYTKEKGEYVKRNIDKPLHIFQESKDNLKRKITEFSTNGLFIWYSGNSGTNNQGSLMGYFVTDSDCFTFYMNLTELKNWKVVKSIGVTVKEANQILEPETSKL